MNSLKDKLELLAIILCMTAVVLIVWFLLFEVSKSGETTDGILVKNGIGRLLNL